MIGGARRQLPSWMVKCAAADQAGISETKGENKENDSEKLDNKGCAAGKKVQRNQQNINVPLPVVNSHFLKECKSRSRKRKLNKEIDEDQGDKKDETDVANAVNLGIANIFKGGDETNLIKKCGTSKRKKISKEKHDDQSAAEKKANVTGRKRFQGHASGKRKHKTEEVVVGLQNGTIQSFPSDDDFTMDDLLSIAEEYVKADKDKELQMSQNVDRESKSQPLLTTMSKTASETILFPHLEGRISVTDEPLSTSQHLRGPSVFGGSSGNSSNNGDPAREMLDLFLGPLLKTTEEVEKRFNVTDEKRILRP